MIDIDILPIFVGCTVSQAHFILMGGLHLYKETEGCLCPCFPLNPVIATQLVIHRRLELPTVQEIRDKSKRSIILGMLTILQTSWFLIDCIVQSTQSLPLTKLDILTVLFISMALLTYIAWWHKPQNVMQPIAVLQTRAKVTGKDFSTNTYMSKPIHGSITLSTVLHISALDKAFSFLDGFTDDVFRLETSRLIPRFYSWGKHRDYNGASIIMIPVMGLISGGISCIAWSFGSLELSFVEIVLWRFLSLSFAFTLLFLVLVLCANMILDFRVRVERTFTAVMALPIALHTISRSG